MNKDVHDILNRYIAAELGRSFVLPDATELSRQRSAFLAHFGPEQLAKMSGTELLRQLPHNASNDQPMDYWLEFKNDEEFNVGAVRQHRGGRAAKFGSGRRTPRARGVSGQGKAGGRSPIQRGRALKALVASDEPAARKVAVIAELQASDASDIDPPGGPGVRRGHGAALGERSWVHKDSTWSSRTGSRLRNATTSCV